MLTENKDPASTSATIESAVDDVLQYKRSKDITRPIGAVKVE
jgi:hypothetical protein